VGEAGDFTSLIGIPLQSPVLQQAGAFLWGRHHQHTNVSAPTRRSTSGRLND